MLFFFDLSFEDSELLRNLFEAHNKKMFMAAYNVTANDQDAEDALQEAFVRILRHVGRINNLPFEARVPFCLTIVMNIAKNILRDRKNTANISDMDELTIGEEFGPEAEFFRSCDIAVLKKMLADLNPDDRRIVVLRCEKKMTYKKIGQLLGISAEAAKKRGERTFARLKEKYLKELCHES